MSQQSECEPRDAWVERISIAMLVDQARSFERIATADPARRFHWRNEANKMWANAAIALLEGRRPV